MFLQEQIKDIIISNDGNPLETGAGAVSYDEKALSAQLGDAMVLGKDSGLLGGRAK